MSRNNITDNRSIFNTNNLSTNSVLINSNNNALNFDTNSRSRAPVVRRRPNRRKIDFKPLDIKKLKKTYSDHNEKSSKKPSDGDRNKSTQGFGPHSGQAAYQNPTQHLSISGRNEPYEDTSNTTSNGGNGRNGRDDGNNNGSDRNVTSQASPPLARNTLGSNNNVHQAPIGQGIFTPQVTNDARSDNQDTDPEFQADKAYVEKLTKLIRSEMQSSSILIGDISYTRPPSTSLVGPDIDIDIDIDRMAPNRERGSGGSGNANIFGDSRYGPRDHGPDTNPPSPAVGRPSIVSRIERKTPRMSPGAVARPVPEAALLRISPGPPESRNESAPNPMRSSGLGNETAII